MARWMCPRASSFLACLAALAALAAGCGEVVSDVDGAMSATPDGGGSIDVVVVDAPPCPQEPCANGLACTVGSGCVSGNCECVDPGCATRVCAADDCVCGYGADGTCAQQMTGGQVDPDDCAGANACFAGSCRL